MYVNAYELELSGLTVLRFGRDADWFDYIFQNRCAVAAEPEKENERSGKESYL